MVLEKLTQGRGVKNQDEGCMKKLYGNLHLVAKCKNVLITRQTLKGDFLYYWEKLFQEVKSY